MGEGKAVTGGRLRRGERTAVSRKALILGKRNQTQGSGTAKHPALLDALFCAVHAGGEQGWESDHLEPFPFCPHGSPR